MIEFSVQRRQLMLVFLLGLMSLGLSALASIAKVEDPSFPIARFLVVAVLPGTSTADMERLVVDPIETRLKSLIDVKTLRTEINDSLAVVRVDFHQSVDADKKHDEVLRELSSLRPSLPAELARLDVTQVKSANVNVVEVALISEHASSARLDVLARALKRRLESVDGVRSVVVSGVPEQEIRVELDTFRLAALGIGPSEIIAAVSADSVNVPAGRVDEGARQFSIKTSGDFRSVEEVGDTVVRTRGEAVIHLRDVATVTRTEAPPTQLARFDGKRAVLVGVSQRENQDLFTMRAAVEPLLREFAAQLPADVVLERGFDQVVNVRSRLAGLSKDFAIALSLVLLTLLPLGLRASLVVMISIPLSLSLGLALLQSAGYTLNQLSIVGFVIALGLLVDDSVVVVENISRHMRMGKPAVRAAVDAVREITPSVLGCTATLLFAFLPLLALPGIPGQFIRSLPIAFVFTIAASLLVSLTIVPFLSSRMLREQGQHGNRVLRALTYAIEGLYRPLLRFALRRPYRTLAGAALMVLGSIVLVPRIGFSMFPKAEIPQFIVHVETPDGSSLQQTSRAAAFVERTLSAHPAVARVATTIGREHPMIFYNVWAMREANNIADVFAEAKTNTPEERSALMAALRAELRNYAGARIELAEFAQGEAMEAPIVIRVLGDDDSALAQAAVSVEDVMVEMGGLRDVRNSTTDQRSDIRLHIDHDRAALLGVRVPEVDAGVRLAVGGVVAGQFKEPGVDHTLNIRVTTPSAGRASDVAPNLAALDDVFLPRPSGSAIPLRALVGQRFELGSSRLSHYNRERSAIVTAHPLPGFNTNRLTREVMQRVAKLQLPAGVRVRVGGEAESREQSFGALGAAIVITVFGILAILVIEFRTFRSALIVASAIPLGVVGGLLALYVTGYTLSFMAVIGFVALFGIEVKNSILLVDCTNQLRAEGMTLEAAILRAGEIRFLPILLTTLTALGGLIPLVAARSGLYSPLALVILGGLVSSTFLARIVTPVLYRLLAPRTDPAVLSPEMPVLAAANG